MVFFQLLCVLLIFAFDFLTGLIVTFVFDDLESRLLKLQQRCVQKV